MEPLRIPCNLLRSKNLYPWFNLLHIPHASSLSMTKAGKLLALGGESVPMEMKRAPVLVIRVLLTLELAFLGS